MLDLPKDITNKALLEYLSPGCVIKTEVVFPDGNTARKRLIILSIKNEKTALAITTTRTPVKKLPYRKDDVFLKKEEETMFEEDTYLQLHRILELETHKMQNDYNAHKLAILGYISGKLLETVYQKVSVSKVIERKYIQRIQKEIVTP